KPVFDTTTLQARYVPNDTVQFGLKAAVSIGTSANGGYAWNSDAWLEVMVGPAGGLQKVLYTGDHWMMTEVAVRAKKVWGTMIVDMPVSQPVLHANLVANVDLKPAITGSGWAEMHFEPGRWYINVGTPQKPDSVCLLPASLDLKSTAFLQLDKNGVA